MIIHMSKTLHTTTLKETIIPVTYIDRYSDPRVKALIHEYKFTRRGACALYAKDELTLMLTDLCIEIITTRQYNNPMSTVIFSSPPSTMHARREKSVDSMWDLLLHTSKRIYWYVKKPLRTHVFYMQIFTVRGSWIKNRHAQHIHGSRKKRIADIQSRYSVRIIFKIYLYFLITIKQQQSFSFYIIDDVTSTGGTLLACSETLRIHMQHIQKKKPEISFDIQVFSLTH